MLGEAEPVTIRFDGPRRHYALACEGSRDLEAWLAPFREAWAERLDALKAHLDQMPDRSGDDDDADQAGTVREDGEVVVLD